MVGLCLLLVYRFESVAFVLLFAIGLVLAVLTVVFCGC